MLSVLNAVRWIESNFWCAGRSLIIINSNPEQNNSANSTDCFVHYFFLGWIKLYLPNKITLNWWWWIVFVIWLTDERRNHCQRSSPLRISDIPRSGFAPAKNLSSGLVEWCCAVVITTTPLRISYNQLS